MTTTTLAPEAAAFVDAVAAELADLPEDVLTDLLDDVRQHLAEVLAEGSLDDLGSPADYATELRSAAGLESRDAAGNWALVRAARRRHARLAQTGAYREVKTFLPELRPAWWVARGYLLVVAFARLTHESLHEVLPIPYVSGNAVIGLCAVAGAVVASVRWGRRAHVARGWRRTALVVVNTAAVASALVVFSDVDNGVEPSYYYYASTPEGLYGPYGQVTDIVPYDEMGHPLQGVRLLDQDGRWLAPQMCDSYCARETFPLQPGSDKVFATPTPSPTPTTTPEPTETPSP